MIPHHAQAIELITLTQGRDLSEETLALANEIRDRRVSQVETMTDLLTAWGEPIPETTIDHANAESGEDGEGPVATAGMLDPAAVSDLAAVTDATEFERQWLELMLLHHQGAVDLAQAERDAGMMDDAVELADQISSEQRAESDQLTELLAG